LAAKVPAFMPDMYEYRDSPSVPEMKLKKTT
jgi:hypothetical protein